jgi:uncharacterized protein YqcC (DUF446 family)
MVDDVYVQAAAKIAEIERTMQSLGMWQSEPLSPAEREIRGAFGSGSMTFSQWLQFVFVPKVHARGESHAGADVRPGGARTWRSWYARRSLCQ